MSPAKTALVENCRSFCLRSCSASEECGGEDSAGVWKPDPEPGKAEKIGADAMVLGEEEAQLARLSPPPLSPSEKRRVVPLTPCLLGFKTAEESPEYLRSERGIHPHAEDGGRGLEFAEPAPRGL